MDSSLCPARAPAVRCLGAALTLTARGKSDKCAGSPAMAHKTQAGAFAPSMPPRAVQCMTHAWLWFLANPSHLPVVKGGQAEGLALCGATQVRLKAEGLDDREVRPDDGDGRPGLWDLLGHMAPALAQHLVRALDDHCRQGHTIVSGHELHPLSTNFLLAQPSACACDVSCRVVMTTPGQNDGTRPSDPLTLRICQVMPSNSLPCKESVMTKHSTLYLYPSHIHACRQPVA